MSNPRKVERGKAWRGVAWIHPVKGVCPKHQEPVGPITKLCLKCHREQIEAAANGSSEWETPK